MTPEGEVVWVWVPHDTTLWSWRSDLKICATKKHERQWLVILKCFEVSVFETQIPRNPVGGAMVYIIDLQSHAKIKKTTIDLDTNYTVITWIQQRDMLIPLIHDLLVYLNYLKLVVGWLASIHWKMTCFGGIKSESIYAAFMPCSSLRNPLFPETEVFWCQYVSCAFFFGMYFLRHNTFSPHHSKNNHFKKIFFSIFSSKQKFQARSIQGMNSVDPR